MSKNQHGGNIYEFSAAHHVDENKVLDFSANINPLGMSPVGKKALQTSWEQCIHYPDIHNKELLIALSRHLSLSEESILMGNGAAELLYALMATVVTGTVYVPAPGFSEYKKSAKAFNRPVVFYTHVGEASKNTDELRDAEKEPISASANKLTDEAVNKLTDEAVNELPDAAVNELIDVTVNETTEIASGSLFIVGNPNNPDGRLVGLEDLKKILVYAQKHNSYVLVDESFIEFTDESHSARQLLAIYDNLLILHSLTKFYAVPGLRLGALLGHAKLLKQVQLVIPAWSVNRPAQIYGKAALTDEAYIKASKEFIQKEKQRFYEALKEFPFLKVIKPTVNFILIRWLPESPDLQAFTAFLNRRYIMIRNCESYEGLGTGWFRIAVKKQEENDVLLLQVKEFANEHNLFSSSWSD